ncbi:hypothetical protein [Solirubrobacter soli]|uniref:hypothetical protein n=1 Tax=Solirubrobacter soli TaxID=363832 RepID=UPI00041C3829|nr:hypothetical protein [Solirubrobacter soli]
MSVEASGKNMGVIYRAKETHDKTCPWGGKANRVVMSYFDIERLGWEEGDVIAGLVIEGDAKMTTMTIRVKCDAEPDEPKQESEEVDEVVEAVSERELVTVSPGGDEVHKPSWN